MDFKVKSNKEIFKNAKDEAIERALIAIGFAAEGYAKKRCPVDTGNLRNSISTAVRGDTAYIGTNVEYAPYVEFGHNTKGKPVAAQPYLKPAITDHNNEYKQLALNELKRG